MEILRFFILPLFLPCVHLAFRTLFSICELPAISHPPSTDLPSPPSQKSTRSLYLGCCLPNLVSSSRIDTLLSPKAAEKAAESVEYIGVLTFYDIVALTYRAPRYQITLAYLLHSLQLTQYGRTGIPSHHGGPARLGDAKVPSRVFQAT
jgi:hypothetical protein